MSQQVVSARGHGGLPPLALHGGSMLGVAPFQMSSTGNERSNGAWTDRPSLEHSSRRKAAIKKAFKRLDPLGSGRVPLDEVTLTLAAAPALSPAAQQALRLELSRLGSQGSDGRPMLTFTAFASYYQGISGDIAKDSDFEQLLQAHWGYLEVSDILASMQRQFALFGMAYAFQELGNIHEIGPRDFEVCLKRIGLLPRPDDLQRVYSAFVPQGGGGLRLDDFREQLLAPRPETPMMAKASRDLVTTGPQHIATASATAAVAAACAGTPRAMSRAIPGYGANPTTSMTHQQAPRALPAPATSSAAIGGAGAPAKEADLDAELARMEAELTHIRKQKVDGKPPLASTTSTAAPSDAAPAANNLPEVAGPVSEADMDAALSSLENRLNSIKAHKAASGDRPPMDLAAAEKLLDLAPVEMPHWEAHKYGHHKITEPAWKPAEKTTDMYGAQHSSTEYGYSNYGVGSHSHHLAHYHLNDYGGLNHHAFKKQEYQRQQFGDAAHHGHWVPHLHGIGTESYHSRHGFAAEDFHSSTYGKSGGAHSHWVPHLHGVGESARPQ